MAQVDLAGGALHLRFVAPPPLRPEALVGAVRRLAGATLSPQGVLRVPLPPAASALLALGSVLQALEPDLGEGTRASSL